MDYLDAANYLRDFEDGGELYCGDENDCEAINKAVNALELAHHYTGEYKKPKRPIVTHELWHDGYIHMVYICPACHQRISYKQERCDDFLCGQVFDWTGIEDKLC